MVLCILLILFLILLIYPQIFNINNAIIFTLLISGIYILNKLSMGINETAIIARRASGEILGGGILSGSTKSETADEKYMKMKLMDPKHNLREVAKQLILLEDHMSHKRKRCIDCITKHYLMTEALLEEAITLDKEGIHVNEINDIIKKLKPVMMALIEKIKQSKINDEIYHSASQVLRTIRKSIGLKYVV